MSDDAFNRPPRLRPRWQADEVTLPTAPAAPAPDDAPNWLSALLPALAGLVMLAGSFGNPAALRLMLPLQAVTLLSSLLLIGQDLRRRRQRRRAHAEQLEHYRQRRAAALSTLRRLHDEERAARNYLDPAPHELAAVAGAGAVVRNASARLWERRRSDDDLLVVRVGSGTLIAAAQPRGGSDDDTDQRCWTLSEQPICLPLAELGSLGVAGPPTAARQLVSALLAQVIVWHAPTDVRIALFCAEHERDEWNWWPDTPHSRSDPLAEHSPALIADQRSSAEWLAAWLLDHLSRRRDSSGQARRPPDHLIIVCDGPQHIDDLPALADVVRHGPAHAISVIVICDDWAAVPADCAAMVETDGLSARWTRAGQPWPTQPFRPDAMLPTAMHRLAARLHQLRLRDTGSGSRIPPRVLLHDLLPADAAIDQPHWPPPPDQAWHAAVPIGALAEGRPLLLNLNEQRHGPHGIIAGATGAGKSILLQTIIASLALSHDPQRLNLLLIDFKGGAALAPFSRLPHCSGLVTDLEPALADRVLVAITAELRRRKQLLRDAGSASGRHIEHIGDYRRYAADSACAPLANLLIVLDEFDELARHQPEFVSALVRVVKQGRSLGVHLLIATQQPSRVVSDEIRSQLSYFLALRLGSSEDSRDMLLRPDAAFLPAELPGRAYLRSGNDLKLFQVAQPAPSLTAVVDAICRRDSQPAPTIWQPPLPGRLVLSAEQRRRSDLSLVAGLIDRPDECRYAPLLIDPRAGHLLIVGAAQSGKSTLLSSLVLELCARCTADALWIYLIDGDGRVHAALSDLPQVGAVIRPHERERMQALFALLERETTRRRRTQQPAPLILLLIDGIAAWRDEQRDDLLEQQSDTLLRLARLGHETDLRLLIGAERLTDLPYRLTALCPQRLVLRLHDPAEYVDLLGARPAALPQLPGRGYWRDDERLQLCQLALPAEQPADQHDQASPAALLRRLVNALPVQPTTCRAPRPAVPAEHVTAAQLPAVTVTDSALILPLGLSHDPPGTCSITLDAVTGHFLISGGRRSGKSSLLLLIAQRLAAAAPQLQLALIDGPRRHLAQLRNLPQLQHYVTDEPAAAALAAELDARRSRAVTCRLVILIDDYPLMRERLRSQLGSNYGDERNLAARLNEVAAGADSRCHLIVAGSITFCDDSLLRTLDAARHGLLLWPHRFERGTRLLECTLPLAHHAEQEPPPGRALLVADDELRLLQLAAPAYDDPAAG